MSDIEEEYGFECPYCMAQNSVPVERGAGKKQRFVTDCETCCRPIRIELLIEEDGFVELTAEREND